MSLCWFRKIYILYLPIFFQFYSVQQNQTPSSVFQFSVIQNCNIITTMATKVLCWNFSWEIKYYNCYYILTDEGVRFCLFVNLFGCIIYHHSVRCQLCMAEYCLSTCYARVLLFIFYFPNVNIVYQSPCSYDRVNQSQFVYCSFHKFGSK